MSVLILDSKRLDQHLTTEDGSFDEKCWKSLMVNSTEDLVAIMEEPNRKMSCLQTMNQIRIGIAKGRSIVLLTMIADYYGGMRG